MAPEEDEVSTTQEIADHVNRTRQPETSNEGRAEAHSMLPTCNIIMRHAVNKSVHAGIKVKPESFAAFKIEMASPSFKEELEKARDKTRRVLERQES